jgi:tetratricopeptide (TPR) repeat protein
LCQDDVFFLANLGGAYGALGDFDKAISSLKRGLNLDPQKLRLRVNLALTYMKMKNYRDAVQILEQIPISKRQGNRDIQEVLSTARKKLESEGNIQMGLEAFSSTR